MKYIYSHMGLGDHIICNGLYRELIQSNQQYSLFVKSINMKSVSFMMRDLKNLNLIEVTDDIDVHGFLVQNRIENIIIIGFCRMPLRGATDFDDSFYIQHGVPFEKRWSSFYCERDLESEKRLFNRFNVKEGEYIFIHDDKPRGYEIEDSFIINKELPIVRPKEGYTDNAFDYCYLMQHSKESHFIDSSFRLIFDSLLHQIQYICHIIKNQIYDNWKGLPILQVDDYSELTNELMDSFLNQEFSNDLLYMDYWKKIIRNQI